MPQKQSAQVWSLVLFRSENLQTAGNIYKGMIGLNGISLPTRLAGSLNFLPDRSRVVFEGVWEHLPMIAGHNSATFGLLLMAAGAFAFFPAPFAQTALSRARPAHVERMLSSWWFAIATAMAFWLAVLNLGKPGVFLYFQF